VKGSAGVAGARGRAMGGGGGGALTGHGTGLGTKMWQDSSSLLGPSSVSHSSLYDGERERQGGSERGSKVHEEGRREGGGGGGETEDLRRKFTSRLLTSHLDTSSHRSSHYAADIASNNGGTSVYGGACSVKPTAGASSHRLSHYAADIASNNGRTAINGGTSIFGGMELGSTRPSPRCDNHMMYKWLTLTMLLRLSCLIGFRV
jgi:hypothetical protein